MGQLFDDIRAAAEAGSYVVGQHAVEQLEDRKIEQWQAVAGLGDGRLLAERPRTRPFPSVEVDQILPDGTRCKAVWSYAREAKAAKLVTVHYYDR